MPAAKGSARTPLGPKEKEENNDKPVLELMAHTQQRDEQPLEPDHSRNQERFYEDMTGKIIRGVTDKIARNNSEELEAERVRYENARRELLEVNMEKTKLNKKKKKIGKFEEQIKELES